jgi:hypothetical protein
VTALLIIIGFALVAIWTVSIVSIAQNLGEMCSLLRSTIRHDSEGRPTFSARIRERHS